MYIVYEYIKLTKLKIAQLNILKILFSFFKQIIILFVAPITPYIAITNFWPPLTGP